MAHHPSLRSHAKDARRSLGVGGLSLSIRELRLASRVMPRHRVPYQRRGGLHRSTKREGGPTDYGDIRGEDRACSGQLGDDRDRVSGRFGDSCTVSEIRSPGVLQQLSERAERSARIPAMVWNPRESPSRPRTKAAFPRRCLSSCVNHASSSAMAPRSFVAARTWPISNCRQKTFSCLKRSSSSLAESACISVSDAMTRSHPSLTRSLTDSAMGALWVRFGRHLTVGMMAEDVHTVVPHVHQAPFAKPTSNGSSS